MPRPEKVAAVADIRERIEQARAVFIAEYSGLSVREQQELRRGLREVSAEFKVFKMTLARLAAAELGHGEEMAKLLMGPSGLAFTSEDAATAAKVLRDFAKDHERLVIKGGLLAGELIPPEKVAELADLEPRDVILAKIAGVFQAPLAKMAGLLAAMPRDLASMVQQLIDKTPSEPEPAAEAPAGGATEDPTAETVTPEGETGAAGGEEPAASAEESAEAADDGTADEAEEE